MEDITHAIMKPPLQAVVMSLTFLRGRKASFRLPTPPDIEKWHDDKDKPTEQ
jgi:hypothetical protein